MFRSFNFKTTWIFSKHKKNNNKKIMIIDNCRPFGDLKKLKINKKNNKMNKILFGKYFKPPI